MFIGRLSVRGYLFSRVSQRMHTFLLFTLLNTGYVLSRALQRSQVSMLQVLIDRPCHSHRCDWSKYDYFCKKVGVGVGVGVGGRGMGGGRGGG